MSPIKGISEVIRLPRLGKIRLGIKNEVGGTAYPEPTDYFVCPEEVKKAFGEKPIELRIMFPTNDPAQWASQYLRCYSDSRLLICKGNGETAISSFNSSVKEVPCDPASCNFYRQGRCRPMMNLQFLLPNCPGYGVYQLDTSSYHSMVNINSSLELARNIFGRFCMIPFSLLRVGKEVHPEGQTKIAQVLSLLPTFSIEETLKYAQMPPEQALVLPPPDNEAPDDFFPEESTKKEIQSQRFQKDALVELWDRAKRKVWQFEMQDYQVAHYFRKYCHMEAGLKDFESSLPPEKFKAEHLEGFLKDIEKHTQFS
ncbi:hypothetical protein [Dehalococcoides mccartyi]|uniref:recombination directionality factor n=1 Tax=Dehalococcoides mccartyi TaxID=61435 RepID=UPI0006BD7C76|nr:hypothetical protein [Dehalococcoides mccartyi]BAS31207.1 hypothetical protein IBK_0132 [Dehalococcoides mccartyi IBARAKI]